MRTVEDYLSELNAQPTHDVRFERAELGQNGVAVEELSALSGRPHEVRVDTVVGPHPNIGLRRIEILFTPKEAV